MDYPVCDIQNIESKHFTCYLVPSIMAVIRRVCSITADEVPNYRDFETQSGSTDPILKCLEWEEIVEKLTEERSSKRQKTSKNSV